MAFLNEFGYSFTGKLLHLQKQWGNTMYLIHACSVSTIGGFPIKIETKISLLISYSFAIL